MSEEQFKYPPGITTVQEWSARIAIRPGDIEAIQQDAVSAARREAFSKLRNLIHYLNEAKDIVMTAQEFRSLEEAWSPLSAEQLAANNAAHKEKVCRCVFAGAYSENTYEWGGVKMCGYCDRPIL